MLSVYLEVAFSGTETTWKVGKREGRRGERGRGLVDHMVAGEESDEWHGMACIEVLCGGHVMIESDLHDMVLHTVLRQLHFC